MNNPGTITLSHEESPAIYFENTTDNYKKKTIYTQSGALLDGTSVGGQILVMNGGGVTIVGGGQSGDTTYLNLTDTGYQQYSQSLLLTADTDVQIISNTQNWDERKNWVFATTGNTAFPGNLYLKGESTPVGYLMITSNTSAISVPNQTSKAVVSITLTPGTWILQCHVHFPGNATGLRRANLSATSGSTADYMQVSVLPANFRTPITFTHMTYVTANSYTYYFNVQHTAGTSLSIAVGAAQIRAIHIA